MSKQLLAFVEIKLTTRPSRIKQVRDLLRQSSDGLTVKEIIKAIPDVTRPHLSRILNNMPDAYIDRWQSDKTKRWHRAVWCVVIPPENCPKPQNNDERRTK